MTVIPVDEQGEVDDGWATTGPTSLSQPPHGIDSRSYLEQLQEALDGHSDAYDTALVELERAELAYNHAESVALVTYEGKVAATILRDYCRAQCDPERAAFVSARLAAKRAQSRLDVTEHQIMAETSRLKHFGAADGGAR